MGRKALYVSKKTKQEKVLTNVCIPSDLFEKVSKKAPEVYGVVRGALSYAVEEGLSLWLLNHSGALMGTPRQNPHKPLRDVYNAVIWDLEKNVGSVPITLPHRMFLPCVMRALNVKERAALGWLYRFYTEGLIKSYNPPGINILKPTEIRYVVVWELVAREA